MFAGVKDEFNRLAEAPTLQASMLSVTPRGLWTGTVHLTYYVAKQYYANNIRIPTIYSQYRAYLAFFEAKIVNLIPQYPLIPRFAESINQHGPLDHKSVGWNSFLLSNEMETLRCLILMKEKH